MLKRLFVAALESALVGGGATALLFALGLGFRDVVVVYAAAALTGAATGLIAGKPVWAKSAKLEALLKAAVGTFLAVTSIYGLRKWLPSVSLDLGVALGSGSIGRLPAVSLPLIAFAISCVFEVDDAFGPRAAPAPRRGAIRENALDQPSSTLEPPSVEAERSDVSGGGIDDDVSAVKHRGG